VKYVHAIETRYQGYHFRSRLEARWAVFFDTLGIPWEYEPQGFELVPLGTGRQQDDVHLGHYLPDFYLPSVRGGTWYEVKGQRPTDLECSKAWRLSELTGQTVMVAFGGIPFSVDERGRDEDVPSYGGDGPRDIWLDGGCDFDYAWCVCPQCGAPGITFEARGDRVCGVRETDAWREGESSAWVWRCTNRPAHGYHDKGYTGDDDRILAAYAAARSARFEHGHCGAS